MADDYDVVEYEKGHPGFLRPEYKETSIQYALIIFGVTLMASQIGITLGKLPASYWPLTLMAFIGGLTCNIWIYFSMEHRASLHPHSSEETQRTGTGAMEGYPPEEKLAAPGETTYRVEGKPPIV